MPYSNCYDQIVYNHIWYLQHQNDSIQRMSKYYYENRAKILKQDKLKYKQYKKDKNNG
jgi:hypothetical protein